MTVNLILQKVNISESERLESVKNKDKSTRARARIGAYALNRTDSEVARLVRTLEPDDFEGFAGMVRRELTPAGLELLKTILRMTVQTPVFGPGQAGVDEGYQVRPFTRSDLGDYLRKGERLNPHDIKLVDHMVKLTVLRQERQALPAQRMVGRSGDELMVGAGWEYVYVIAPIAALSLLYATSRHRAYVASLRSDQTLEAQPDSAWKRWIGR
jgi:hypothetical protein